MMGFLRTVWAEAPGQYGELRFMKDGAARQEFVRLDHEDTYGHAEAVAQAHAAAGWDAFFGVLPRESRSGRAKDVPPWTSWLWADLDGKKADPDPKKGKTLALQAVNRFHTPPQIIVDSGLGVHCYWHLDRLEPLDRAQAVMAHIADELKGDRVHDAPRILRVPGTRNYKYIPAPDVRLLIFDRLTTVRLADFEAFLPIAAAPRKVRATSYAAQREFPDWLLKLIAEGVPRGQRSEASYRAMVWMLRYGATYDDIHEAFSSNVTGIGEKYTEKRADGDRWFGYTFNAAQEAV